MPTKPTLVQSLLNLPSQSYANADATRAKKEYHSTKQEMLRIAAAAQAAAQTQEPRGVLPTTPMNTPRAHYRPTAPLPEDDEGDSDLDVFFTPNTSPRTSMASSVATITFPATRKPSRRSLTTDTHLPLQLSVPVEQQQRQEKSLPAGPLAAVPSTRTPSTSSTRARHALSSTSSLSSTTLDGHSVFSDFVGSAESTVLSTPYQSDSANGTPRATTKGDGAGNRAAPTANGKARGQPHVAEKEPKRLPPTDPHKSRTHSRTQPTTGAEPNSKPDEHPSQKVSSKEGGSAPDVADKRAAEKGKEREREKKPAPRTANHPAPHGHTSAFTPTSTSTTTTSTTTKPYAPPKKQPHTFSAFASISASSSPSSPSPSPLASPSPPIVAPATAPDAYTPKKPANGRDAVPPSKPAPGSAMATSSSKSTPNTNPPKPPSSMSGASKSDTPSSPPNGNGNGNANTKANLSPSPKSSRTPPKPSSPPPKPPAPHPLPAPPHQPQPQRKKPNTYKPPPSTSGALALAMDALLEEDEDGPLTPRMEERAIEERGWYAAGYSEEEYQGERSRSLRHTSPGHVRRRRSLEDDSSSSSNSNSNSQSHSASTSTHKHPRTPKTLSAEAHSQMQSFSPAGARPSNGTQGYTPLVLPRAPPPLSAHSAPLKGHKDSTASWLASLPASLALNPDGRVDLTQSGVAQTTMASVEVVRGLGSRARGRGWLGGLGGLVRRRASSGSKRSRGPAMLPIPLAHEGDDAAGGGAVDGVGVEDTSSTNTPLGFTAHRAPPGYVPRGGVLVQVWAVGVDGVDGRLVGVRFGQGGEGARGAGANGYAGEAFDDDDNEEDDDGADAGGENEERDSGEMQRQQQRTDREETAETETETEREDGEETETETATETQYSTPKKGSGGFAALGRSLSLRLSKRGGGGAAKGSPSAAGASPLKTASQNTKAHGQSESPQTSTPGGASPPSANGHKRSLSFSLKRSNTATSSAAGASPPSSSPPAKPQKNSLKKRNPHADKTARPDVGYIPGRSFVGRVLECGWDVRDEVVRKGEWVVGLLDVRKGGALAEFIVVDRHRVHRVPQPKGGSATQPVWAASPTAASPGLAPPPPTTTTSTLTLEELALLPLCGLPAYRAVRTFLYAFSSSRDRDRDGSSADRRALDFVGNAGVHTGTNTPPAGVAGPNPATKTLRGTLPEHDATRRRRVLVLRGHDGPGAMAVQMLAVRGWQVSVHVPCAALPASAPSAVVEHFMQLTEERARAWGADEIIHDDSATGDDGRAAAVRLIEMIRADGDVFDAVLDTVGGREVREAGERLLRSPGVAGRRRDHGQFTTLVGDTPHRVVPSAGDNFRAGLRSLRVGGTTADASDGARAGDGGSAASGGCKVGYAWVSVAQDVDWEGVGVGETLGTVVRMALEDGVRPVVEDMDVRWKGPRVAPRAVPFEYTPNVFVDDGPLRDGGTVVVKIAE